MNEKRKSLDIAIVKRDAIMKSVKDGPKASIVADRKKQKNQNGLILGTPGEGVSFFIGRPGSGKVLSCIVPNNVSAENDKF